MPTYAKYLHFDMGPYKYKNEVHLANFKEAILNPYADDSKTKMIMQAISGISAGDTGHDQTKNYELYTKATELGYHVKASNLQLNEETKEFTVELEFWFPTDSIFESWSTFFSLSTGVFFSELAKPMGKIGVDHDTTKLTEKENVHYKKPFPS